MTRSIEWYRGLGPLKVGLGMRVRSLDELMEGKEGAGGRGRLRAAARELEERSFERSVLDWESEGGRVAGERSGDSKLATG